MVVLSFLCTEEINDDKMVIHMIELIVVMMKTMNVIIIKVLHQSVLNRQAITCPLSTNYSVS